MRLNSIGCLWLLYVLTGCGGGGTETSETPQPPVTEQPTPPNLPPAPPVEQPSRPINYLTSIHFHDQDPTLGEISGDLLLIRPTQDNSGIIDLEYVLFWYGQEGDYSSEPFHVIQTSEQFIVIAENTPLPVNTLGIAVALRNSAGNSEVLSHVEFRDYQADVWIAGPGGNELDNWFYGIEKPALGMKKSSHDGAVCEVSNGLVSVTHMQFESDERPLTDGQGIVADDIAYPPYQFECDPGYQQDSDTITDDYGPFTYSAVNDALYYGTLSYNALSEYTVKPPLGDMARLRVHYGSRFNTNAFWDGAYANFSDAYPMFYSTVALDIVAHEMAHGMLEHISELSFFNGPMSNDAKTAHEAFADISGVMVKAKVGHTDHLWQHGAAVYGPVRQLDQVITESGASASYLDRGSNGNTDNFYLNIGLLTFPFYVLGNEWDISSAYRLYVNAAATCWHNQMSLLDAAQCIVDTADSEQTKQQVVAAFRQIKLPIGDNLLLSHFSATQSKLQVRFNDTSEVAQGVVDIDQLIWDFGDDNTSSEVSPSHQYTQAGDYAVTLTVISTTGLQDSFTRQLTVTDQYCSLRSSGSPLILGGSVNQQPWMAGEQGLFFDVSDSDELHIVIDGDGTTSIGGTDWALWIDIDDNGVFGEDERFVSLTFPPETPFGANISLDITDLPTVDGARMARIIGGTFVPDSCSGASNRSVDMWLHW